MIEPMKVSRANSSLCSRLIILEHTNMSKEASVRLTECKHNLADMMFHGQKHLHPHMFNNILKGPEKPKAAGKYGDLR